MAIQIPDFTEEDKQRHSYYAEHQSYENLYDRAADDLLDDILTDTISPYKPLGPVSSGLDSIPLDGTGILSITSNTNPLDVSKYFNTYGMGPTIITADRGDGLGRRYGSYGFASTDNINDYCGCTIKSFINDFPEFRGLEPETQEFDNMWREVASADPYFEQKETAFMEKQIAQVIDINGMDFKTKQAVATVVSDFGGNTTKSKKFFDNVRRGGEDISVDSIYKERLQINKYFNVPYDVSLQQTKGRMRQYFITKDEDLTSLNSIIDVTKDLQNPEEFWAEKRISESLVEETEPYSAENGFMDPAGKYPRSTRLGEPDYDRLSRGETKDTPIEFRRNRLKTGIQTASGGSWDEPEPQYAAEYPHNVVLQDQSGIVIERDSTPGSERLHIYHPSHTYIEIDREGNVTVRTHDKMNEIVDTHKREYVGKHYNRTVDGTRTSKVAKNEHENVGGSCYVTIGANNVVTIGGDATITVGGNCTLQVGGTLDIDSGGITTIN